MRKLKAKTSNGEADLISRAEAARLRGVSWSAIDSLIQRGKLRIQKVDGRITVYRSEIENFKPGLRGRPKLRKE
jgi:hypothetical protein